ncbi:MAG: hypothetical protein HYX69_14165 [Planctomycetia bacterium]|nr:hypothetical protein [Planctomycetia bacterium]
MLTPISIALLALVAGAAATDPAADEARKPLDVAAVVSVYHHNAHADVIVSRLMEGYTLDGKGDLPSLRLAGLYVDQTPQSDISRRLAERHGVTIYDSVAGALERGQGRLAVDGVLLVAEHGDYPRSPTGQVIYPKRRLFEQVVQVFERSGRVVSVFVDKHLADNWADAKWIYDTAARMKIPLMAGSSLPTTWRHPPLDMEAGAALTEIVGVSYHTLDAYGFHALEALQSLVERRRGGETGIRAVECLTDDAVWAAGERGVYSKELLAAALERLERTKVTVEELRERVKNPVLFRIEYADGLTANVLTLNGAVSEWAFAWRAAQGQPKATVFYTQEARPFMHFTYLLKGIEQMMHTGRAAWPAERTLITSGALDALHISKSKQGARVETPYLTFPYAVDWKWREPPPPPPDRPINGQ